MSFVVTFNLKSPYKGDAVPIVYGSCNELGNGEPTHGIEFINDPNSIYNYQAKVRFSKEINKDTIWYSYCFRPSYGSMILENAPRRFLPKIQLQQNRPDNRSKYQTQNISLYDTIDEITPINEFIVHFRIRCFTQFGQHLYIVGSCESLGNWDPHKAIQLFYEGNQDYWSCHVKMPLSNSPQIIEYKYFRTFVPKRKPKEKSDKRERSYSTNTTSTQRASMYKDMYKDFYRNKNRTNFFFNSNRNDSNRITVTNPPPKPITVETVEKNDDFDLNGIEWEPANVQNHRIEIEPITSPTVLEIVDTFRWSDPAQESLTTAPFINVINSRKSENLNGRQIERKIVLNNSKPGIVSVRFEAICPNIMRHQDLYIVGSIKELGDWNYEKGLKMDDRYFPLFVATIELKRPRKKEKKIQQQSEELLKTKETEKNQEVAEKKEFDTFPFEYKFVIVCEELREREVEVEDNSPLSQEELQRLEEMKAKLLKANEEQGKKIVIDEAKLIESMHRTKKVMRKGIEKVGIWESSPNRYCPGITSHIIPDTFPSTLLIDSWFVNPNSAFLKRYGICVPLFSLRSSDSCGIGQYDDIRHLVDFCKRVGATVIQFPLPLFDTNTAVIGELMNLSFSDPKLNSLINNADENPFNIVSAFALHPIYISLFDIVPNLPEEITDDINRTKWELEKKAVVDYKAVLTYKMRILWRIYKEVILADKMKSDPKLKNFDFSFFYQSKIGALLLDDLFDKFVEKESFWLFPYSLFCFFREKFKDADFRNWPKEVSEAFENCDSFSEKVQNLSKLADEYSSKSEGQFQFDLTFFLWIQYVCNSQFSKAASYAKQSGIAFKGVLPLNVSFCSADCWSFPSVFRHSKDPQKKWNYQTVSVPDEPNEAATPMRPIACTDHFTSCSVFPSFDWSFLHTKPVQKKFDENSEKPITAEDWWQQRMTRCCELYQALKIDPALNVYRSWEVDSSKSVTSCLGHFYPCDPISQIDLDARNLKDIERYTRPYIKRSHLVNYFGQAADSVGSRFFVSKEKDTLAFKDEFSSERKIYEAFRESQEGGKEVIDGVKNGYLFETLMKLQDDVLLIEDDDHPGKFFLRANFFNQPLITLSDSGSGISQLQPSTSYSELPRDDRLAMKDLYDYYTYIRQNELWLQSSRDKQKNVFNSATFTHPLLCLDDIELSTCPSLSYEIRDRILSELQTAPILGLNVQALNINKNNQGYLSVCSPSLHNTPTLRGCLEEGGGSSNEPLRHDESVSQALQSESQLALFLLQDVADLIQFFRRQEPSEEQITHPLSSLLRKKEGEKSGSSCYYSCENSCRVLYRVPYSVNELAKNDELSSKLRKLAEESNRTLTSST